VALPRSSLSIHLKIMWPVDDLIVAAATPLGFGARAIVRLTGAGLDAVLPRLFDAVGTPGFARPGEPPRLVEARLACDGLGHEWGAVPVAVLHWPGPGGPVGGPLAEVQLPGSAALVDAVVAEACRHGARLARGGEFTLRSFLAGRLDLVQAEAVLGVVDARTPAELSAALDRMAGGAGAALRRVRSDLLDLLADVEAALDFADESTPDAVPVADAAARRAQATRLAALRAEVTAVAAALDRRDAGSSAERPRVVLVGRPNVGKSSLFNALCGHAAALVADEAGTTRDWLEARLATGAGTECTLVDLAGIADDPPVGDDAVAAAAADAARGEIARADVIVACHDAGDPVPPASRDGVPRIDVITRCDRRQAGSAGGAIRTSAVESLGIDELRAAIGAAVAALPPRSSPATLRMAVGVAACAAAMAAAAAAVEPGSGGDEAVAAAYLHRAVAALDEVTGAAIGTDLLDRIFSRHCVGK
jgi:tRNA modification GTPase